MGDVAETVQEEAKGGDVSEGKAGKAAADPKAAAKALKAAEKAEKKAAKLAARTEKKRIAKIRAQARARAWNEPLTNDGLYIYIVRLIVFFLVLIACIVVTLAFYKLKH